MSDPINPDHYKGNGMSAIDVVDAFELDYYLGSAWKYMARYGKKGDPIEQLEKARWFLDRRIEQLQSHSQSLGEEVVYVSGGFSDSTRD